VLGISAWSILGKSAYIDFPRLPTGSHPLICHTYQVRRFDDVISHGVNCWYVEYSDVVKHTHTNTYVPLPMENAENILIDPDLGVVR